MSQTRAGPGKAFQFKVSIGQSWQTVDHAHIYAWHMHCLIARLQTLPKHPKSLSLKSIPPHHTAMYLQQLSLQLPVNTAEWHIPLEVTFSEVSMVYVHLSENLFRSWNFGPEIQSNRNKAKLKIRQLRPRLSEGCAFHLLFFDWKHHSAFQNLTSANMQHAEAWQIQGLSRHPKPMCCRWAASFKQKI